MLALQFTAYAIALWLSCYLLARRPLTRSLAYSGLGLLAYAGALACDVLANAASADGVASWLAWLQWPLLFAPAVSWCLALTYLTPGVALPRWWSAKVGYGAALVAGMALIGGVLSYVAAGPGAPPGLAAAASWADGYRRPGWRYWILAGTVVVALLALLVQTLRAGRV